MIFASYRYLRIFVRFWIYRHFLIKLREPCKNGGLYDITISFIIERYFKNFLLYLTQILG